SPRLRRIPAAESRARNGRRGAARLVRPLRLGRHARHGGGRRAPLFGCGPETAFLVKTAGQIVLFRFPQADLAAGKLRPALLLGALPGPYDDWLICMISSQLRHFTRDFDEIVTEPDSDFSQSGLKAPSVIRAGRLAV